MRCDLGKLVEGVGRRIGATGDGGCGARLLGDAGRPEAVRSELNCDQNRTFARGALPRAKEISLDGFAIGSCLGEWLNKYLAL